MMVSLRFCIDFRADPSYYPSPTREKRFAKRHTMRTGVWSWCSPPRRRRRPGPSPAPPPPPPALSLCPAPPTPDPPSLAHFAESLHEDDALSDMDFSALDDEQPEENKSDEEPKQMLMDSHSKKWTGNETDFEGFNQIIATLGKDDSVPPDQSVFEISDRTAAEWHENGEEHNRWFSRGIKGQDVDIRTLAEQFSNGVKRRKPSS